MQRLMMEYSVGDGYTFSCENTLPFIYENKEKAIDDLETFVLEYLVQKNKVKNDVAALQLIGNALVVKLKKAQNNKQNSKPLDDLREAWAQNFQLQNEAQKQIKDEILFGGQTIYLSHFVSDDGKENIEMPIIYTLDEFYAAVERNQA